MLFLMDEINTNQNLCISKVLATYQLEGMQQMDNYHRKRILITGGAGFLGSHLSERLLKEGNEILCLDNFFTGTRGNIEHLMGDHNFELIRHDIEFPIYLEVDEIYNLACPASPPHYQHNPIHTTKTSVLGAINMLGLAKRQNAKIMQASTSEVYGDPQVHPQTEDYWGNVNQIGIRSCYDEGKRCAETLFFDYYRENQVKIKIARIFNTYGPNMHPSDGRVVSNFIIQAIKNEDITIYGDGSQTRSFCYVDELIDGFIRLMETDAFTGPVNLGNPVEFTIKELAEKIIEMTNSKSRLSLNPLPQDDPKQRQPDITLAKKELGWEPIIKLEEGLKSTISYFEDLIGELGSGNETLKQTIDIINKEGRGVLILVRDSSSSVINNYLSIKAKSAKEIEELKQSELRIFGMGAQILSELGVKDMILLTNTDWKFVGLDAYNINIVETKFLKDLK